MFEGLSERTLSVVDSYSERNWLLWRSPIRAWAWRLLPLTDERTRLITRMHTVYDWRRPWTPVTVLLMELADYPMTRRMLRGIRARAKAEYRRRASGSGKRHSA